MKMIKNVACLNSLYSYLPTHIKFLTEFHAAIPHPKVSHMKFKKCQFSTENFYYLRRKLTFF